MENDIAKEWVNIGKIVAAHSMKGEVRAYSTSDFPERFEKPGTRWILRPNHSIPEPIELIKGRYMPGKNLYILEITGIENRSQAEALQGCELFVPMSDRPILNPGEYHVLDLIDLDVFHQETAEHIGKVTELIVAGNDLLQVETPTGKKILIPFVNEIVPLVDLTQKRIEINPPPGLLELGREDVVKTPEEVKVQEEVKTPEEVKIPEVGKKQKLSGRKEEGTKQNTRGKQEESKSQKFRGRQEESKNQKTRGRQGEGKNQNTRGNQKGRGQR